MQITFFRSYLTNRKQYTLINGEKSDVRTITCGVPQGSVLGPILFLLYVNDIGIACGEEISRLFADDTFLMTYNSNIDTLIKESKDIYSKFFKWCICNKLTVNLTKTNFILFHTKNKYVPDNFQQIEVDSTFIKRVNVVKHLGVWIDEKLSWSHHIKMLCKSLVKYFGIFKNVRYFINARVCRVLYYAFIYSRIMYGIQIYGSCSKNYMSKIQTLQNKLLRSCLI